MQGSSESCPMKEKTRKFVFIVKYMYHMQKQHLLNADHLLSQQL